jgi:hypothetical protein
MYRSKRNEGSSLARLYLSIREERSGVVHGDPIATLGLDGALVRHVFDSLHSPRNRISTGKTREGRRKRGRRTIWSFPSAGGLALARARRGAMAMVRRAVSFILKGWVAREKRDGCAVRR